MEELEWAVEDGEPYNFDYYLILAPMYKETEELEGGGRKVGLDAFVHAEDEFIEEFAGIKFDYKFTRSKRVADSRNSFADTGLAPSRRCLVVHKSKVKDMIKRVESVLEG
ncbi:Mss4p nuclear export [Kickxella alabastrina]|uniref:Mss4p nuclear export n=2 Tax=Kickxella alabastrina TaxID=61397 RepID=A0ACC1I0R6_9FUNG|nr:Mss4p nuclear export [Kickxella alabastrina]